MEGGVITMKFLRIIGKSLQTLLIVIIASGMIAMNFDLQTDSDKVLENLKQLSQSDNFVFVTLDSEYTEITTASKTTGYELRYKYTVEGKTRRGVSTIDRLPEDFGRVKLFYLTSDHQVNSLNPAFAYKEALGSKTPMVMAVWAMILMIVLFAGWLLKRIWLGRCVSRKSSTNEELGESDKEYATDKIAPALSDGRSTE